MTPGDHKKLLSIPSKKKKPEVFLVLQLRRTTDATQMMWNCSPDLIDKTCFCSLIVTLDFIGTILKCYCFLLLLTEIIEIATFLDISSSLNLRNDRIWLLANLNTDFGRPSLIDNQKNNFFNLNCILNDAMQICCCTHCIW